MKIKILSWNIWIDGYFDQVAGFLKSSDADIIGLQEVQTDVSGRDITSFLTELGYEYVFAPVQKSWGGKVYNDGPAIFSKYPIKEKHTYLLSEANSRAAARADIDVNGKILHIFNTHLIHTHQQPSDIQLNQGENLIKLLPLEHTIVMGDFNAAPDSQVIKNIQNALMDSDPKSLPTWSLYLEGCKICKVQDISIRLDYIFTTKDLKTKEFKVENSKASDHLPISVTIEI